ncbi:MAG: CAP domain-containing protein [Sphingomonadaceae bacterium]
MAINFRRVRAASAMLLALAAPLLSGAMSFRDNAETRWLATHNRERATIGLPPMAWDTALARDALGWAQHLAKTGTFDHSPDDPDDDPNAQGENLWGGTRGHYAPEAMVDRWIAEKVNYRPAAIPYSSKTGNFEDVGHYTQVMWRHTRHVGCAMATGAEFDILVCRYRQAGNVEGERPF